MELFKDNSKGAVISKCGNYRYQLWRIWDESKPKVLFIMCNPSTADYNLDDPTIRRCMGFAKSWGYGGLYVGNIFAYRSTNPLALLQVTDPIGKENLKNIAEMHSKCEVAVAAWGNKKLIEVLLKDICYKPLTGLILNYIELSKDGTLKHPLYLKGDSSLKPYQHYNIKT